MSNLNSKNAMIEIKDKQDGERKLRRSYEDYEPVPTEPGETESQPTEDEL